MGQLFRAFMLLMGMSFGVGMAVIGTTRQTYRDPLVQYRAMMPGEPVAGLENYPCRFRTSTNKRQEWGYCQFNSQQSVFREVMLVASQHVITEMTAFNIQPGTLYLGNLILCWGNPISIDRDYPNQTPSLDLYWQNQMHAQVSPPRYTEKLDYALPVTYLSFTGEWEPATREISSCLHNSPV